MTTTEPTPEKASPTREHAAGMLDALRREHLAIGTHETTCTGTFVLGDGQVRERRCPWDVLNLDDAADRRLIQSVYADAARDALTGA